MISPYAIIYFSSKKPHITTYSPVNPRISYHLSLVVHIFLLKPEKLCEAMNSFKTSEAASDTHSFRNSLEVILKFESFSTGLTNLEKKNYWESASKKSINHQIKFTLKISFST